MIANLKCAFSLLEVLLVIAIIAILSAFVAPSLASILEGGRLTQATTLLMGQINLARQEAVSRNEPVFFRMIRASSDAPFTRIQLVTVDPDGRALPVGRVAVLPTQTAIASDQALSSLVHANAEQAAVAGRDPQIPDLGNNYRYVQYSFRPRGSMAVDIQECWFLTVLSEREESATSPPDNYATIQVDPINGGLQVYRP